MKLYRTRQGSKGYRRRVYIIITGGLGIVPLASHFFSESDARTKEINAADFIAHAWSNTINLGHVNTVSGII
jgi:predicted ferric reductase